MNQKLFSKSALPFSVLAIAIVVSVGFIFILRSFAPPAHVPGTQEASREIEEAMVVETIKALPDIVLLRSLRPPQDGVGLEFRTTKKPSDQRRYFVVEVWEDLSGEPRLFQRYRHDAVNDELSIDLPLNPSEFDIFTRSVLDKNTGEIVALINNGERTACTTGTQLVLNFCAGRQADLAEDVLNIVYQRILAGSAFSQEARNTLTGEQQAWVREKESACEHNEGSVAALLQGVCEKQMTRERIETLLETYLQQ